MTDDGLCTCCCHRPGANVLHCMPCCSPCVYCGAPNVVYTRAHLLKCKARPRRCLETGQPVESVNVSKTGEVCCGCMACRIYEALRTP